MRVVNKIDINTWRSFVMGCPGGNIFHSPELFQVFDMTRGYQPYLWAVEKPDGELSALFIPVEVSLNKTLKGLTTRAIAYGSILFTDDQVGRAALQLLLQTYTQEVKNPPLFTELRNLHDLKSAQPVFNTVGFEFEAHLNYLIDVSKPADEVFQSIGRRTRKNIRRARNRNKVEVAAVTAKEQLLESIELIQTTYQNARIPLADASLFENAFNILSPENMIRITNAYVDSQPAATSVELLYKDVIYGWYSGLDRSFATYVPNEQLTWHILKWGSENDYKIYDFGGAGKPDEEYGVRDFKAKFGGELVCYGRNTYTHRPAMLKLSKAGYRVYQTLRSL